MITTARVRKEPRKTRLTLLLAIVILIPSLWGFGTKFLEFIALYRGDVDGLFALTPIANYLLASLGFFCLLCWAALNGMFRDVEQPKRTMLENEARLDREAMSGVRPEPPYRNRRVGDLPNPRFPA